MNPRARLTALATLIALPLSAADKPVRIDLDAQAQPPAKTAAPAPSPAKAKAATTTTGSTATPAGKASVPAKPAKPDKKTGATAKKDATPTKIDGQEVARGDHGFLGIKVEDNTWKISFYDREKKPVVADVAHITLRWPVQYQPNPERAFLSPNGDGKVMTSDKTVRPPFTFTLYVTLLKDAAATDQPAETYVVEFHQ